MNKNDLIKRISNEKNIPTKVTSEIVNCIFSIIEEEVSSGKIVEIYNFGNFRIRQRKQRKGTNPKTGEEIILPPTKFPSFKASKKFRHLVKGEI